MVFPVYPSLDLTQRSRLLDDVTQCIEIDKLDIADRLDRNRIPVPLCSGRPNNVLLTVTGSRREIRKAPLSNLKR
ncbi:hypothetical protein PR048_013108 [Dryococelus australis]|uniref:Uncharacterized protein n=1 Tax=Dryococelus australis TaxID=614101 RepID=A0ABQ9HS37_9NEOP|nr:hypothetical protein PR048_013108 [Dryococelus australis]